MRILITGVNGFLGRHLAKTLIARGHEVTGFGRSVKCEVTGISNYVQGDVLDQPAIERAMQGLEAVVHLAALTAHRDIIDNKFNALETSYLGTKRVLDAFSHCLSMKKFLYSSTGKVYGKAKPLPFTEELPPQPLNVLGKSKFMTEQLIEFYSHFQPNRTTPKDLYFQKKSYLILRIFNVYGPDQRDNFLIPTILNQLKDDPSRVSLGDVTSKRDYIYIDDAIRALVLTLESDAIYGYSVFNVCSGQSRSAEEIVSEISALLGRRIEIRTNPELYRTDEVPDEYGSYDCIRKTLGWTPQNFLRDGLKKTLEKS